MIIVMEPSGSPEALQAVLNRLKEYPVVPKVIRGDTQIVIAVRGDVAGIDSAQIEELEGVARAERISDPYPTITRQAGSVIRDRESVVVNGHLIGNSNPLLMIGGPCSVSSREQLNEITIGVKENGGHLIRAGAFKPRTGPYGFQGLELEGLSLLQEVGRLHEIGTASEATGIFRYVTEERRNQPLTREEAQRVRAEPIAVLDSVVSTVDLPWIGARNGQSFDLIKGAAVEAIAHGKPLMLKRGPWMTIKDYLLALEYIAGLGCRVIACLRGIGQHDVYRYQPDAADIPVIQSKSVVPVIADISHMVGDWRYVETLAYQAIIAGADGLMLEVSTNREQERTDGKQAIDPQTFGRIARFAKDHRVSSLAIA